MHFVAFTRSAEETVGQFCIRLWRAIDPTLPENLTENPPYCETVVRAGYDSPYRFGDKLRNLAGNRDVPVFRFRRVYYAFNEPTTCAWFYYPEGVNP